MSALPHVHREISRPTALRVFYAEAFRRAGTTDLCRIVSSIMRCRRCSLMVAGLDGRLIVEDAVGFPPGLTGVVGAAAANGIAASVAASGRPLLVRGAEDRQARPVTDQRYETESFICYPMRLPGGGSAVINVTEREDRRPFDQRDLETLGQLVELYVASFDVRSRRETLRLRGEIQRLRRQAIRAQEHERQRIARDLHDDSGHVLSAAILRLDMLTNTIGDSGAREAIAVAKEALMECADHLHENAFHLRPRVLLDLGIAPALRSLARRLNQAIDVEVQIHGEERRFGDEIELTLFRIAQEATTNAIRHARASRLTISLDHADDAVVLSVSDNGIGLPFADHHWSDDHDGQGLRSMRERVELIEGTLEFHSQPATGTTVLARLPIGEAH